MSEESQTLLGLSRKMLNAIDAGDWDTYADLCDPALTAFEPEASGQLAEGMDFHRYYFDGDRCGRPQQSTIASPHVRVIGDVAIVCYVRLIQRYSDATGHTTVAPRRDPGLGTTK